MKLIWFSCIYHKPSIIHIIVELETMEDYANFPRIQGKPI